MLCLQHTHVNELHGVQCILHTNRQLCHPTHLTMLTEQLHDIIMTMNLVILIFQHSYIKQVAELASLAQLLPPCSPTMRNPVPDSSLCRAAAPRLRRLQLLLPARLPRSASISAELPSCIRFSCCSPLASTSAAALDCVRFNCFPIASPSAAWLLLPASCSGRFQPCPLFSNTLR